jgi:hypothetical protein
LIDMIKFSGPAFPGIDNWLMSLQLMEGGDAAWEQMVPAAVAEIIKAENLFGWRPGRATSMA